MIVDLKQTKKEVIENMIINPENYAAIYARQSNKSEKVESVEAQCLEGKKIALKNNLLIYKCYKEEMPISNVPINKRKEFNNLIEDAKLGYFKTLIVFKRDRLARDTEQFLQIKTIFKNLGIKIIYSNENEFQPDDTPTSDFIENIIAAVAELEPNTIGERTKVGKEQQRQEGEYAPGKIPYGFIRYKALNKKNTHEIYYYKPDKEKKQFIELLFHTYINNSKIISPKGLSDFLKNSHVHIPEDFKAAIIRNMLNGPIYAKQQLKNYHSKLKDTYYKNEDGTIYINEDAFQEPYNVTEKIISKEDWFKAFKKYLTYGKGNKKREPNSNYMFKNLLFCGKCGKRITFSKSTNKYACGTKKCTKITKDNLIKIIFEKLIDDNFNNDQPQKRLNKKIGNMNKSITLNNNKLFKLSIDQEKNIKSYLKNKSDSSLNELKTNEERQESIRKSTQKINSKIELYKSISKWFSNSNGINEPLLLQEFKKHRHEVEKYLDVNIKKVIMNGFSPEFIEK